MKTPKFYALLGTLILAMVFVSCSKDEADTPYYSSSTSSDSKTLSAFEQEGLISILEMQKMHRDVYAVIATNLDAPAFDNLYERDAQLMELLSIKVDKYGLSNPTQEMQAGEYTNVAIQNEYNEFLRGSNSGWATMLTFAKQMEVDMIITLQEERAVLSGNIDIAKIYDDMIAESTNQLDVLVDEWENLRDIALLRDEHKED